MFDIIVIFFLIMAVEVMKIFVRSTTSDRFFVYRL